MFIITLYSNRLECIVWTKDRSVIIKSELDIKRFYTLKLHYDPVVCGRPNLMNLCYSLAYKEQFSIQVNVEWLICKMHFQHIGTCALENLTVKD